jgi:Tfp pilus assembly major pilin PilA
MNDQGRVVIGVLCALSITALLAVIAIKYVRMATRALVQSHQARDAEAQ